jgi:hypothetical protein
MVLHTLLAFSNLTSISSECQLPCEDDVNFSDFVSAINFFEQIIKYNKLYIAFYCIYKIFKSCSTLIRKLYRYPIEIVLRFIEFMCLTEYSFANQPLIMATGFSLATLRAILALLTTSTTALTSL